MKRETKCVIKRINKDLFWMWNPTMLNPYRNTKAMDSETAKACRCDVKTVREIKKIL